MAQQVCSALMGLELADPEADIKARTPAAALRRALPHAKR
jgi:hypothetical protein